MQRLRTLLLLTALGSPLAHAQLDSARQKTVSQAAFHLTKATVEFVATDKLTFGNLAKTTCETCNDYPSLVRFIKDSKLTKADELVSDAQKKGTSLTTPTATADQVLIGLRQYLHDRVTKGDGRERRLTLPSYKKYTEQAAQILASAGVESDTDDQIAATAADTVDTGEPVIPASSIAKADAGGILSYGGIALLLSLLNLLGLAYLWLQRQNKATPVVRNPLIDELSNRVSMLEKKQKDLISQLNKSVPSPAASTPEPRRPEPATVPGSIAPGAGVPKPAPTTSASELPHQAQVPPITPMPASAPRPPSPAPTPQPSFQNQTVPSNQPRRREVVLYGRTADLGDGFSVGSLLETPDRDTVFQIEVRTDSQAVYRVTEEPGAQQLALSDPYSYLADACEYVAKPMANARIRTTQPGQLALQGDKWKIVEKAKISFY